VLLWPRTLAAPPGARPRPPTVDDTTQDVSTVDDDVPSPRHVSRIVVGAAGLFVAAVGILPLAYGRPARAADAGRPPAGRGRAPGEGEVGAAVVLGGFAVVGAVLALGLSIAALGAAAARGVAGGAVRARRALREGLGTGGVGAGVEVYDQDVVGHAEAIDLVAL